MRQIPIFICCALLIFSTIIRAQFDESIFEDEDIYKAGLPPEPNTNGTTAPGTKWCGPGNTASNYNDLGSQRDTDMCCRDHDHCEDILESATERYGLRNNDWFPILKCSCEQKFLNCLQKVNSMTSNMLGRVYFGSRGKCFAKGYPIVECKEYQEGTFRKRCIRYRVEKNKIQLWQFYDTPFYSINTATLKKVQVFNGK